MSVVVACSSQVITKEGGKKEDMGEHRKGKGGLPGTGLGERFFYTSKSTILKISSRKKGASNIFLGERNNRCFW